MSARPAEAVKPRPRRRPGEETAPGGEDREERHPGLLPQVVGREPRLVSFSARTTFVRGVIERNGERMIVRVDRSDKSVLREPERKNGLKKACATKRRSRELLCVKRIMDCCVRNVI